MITVIVEVRATRKDGTLRAQHVAIALLPSIVSFAKRSDAEQYAATIYKDFTISLVPRILTEIEDK